MDTNRMKKAAEWFYGNIFKEEAIRPRAAQPSERVPSLLRTARSLENGNNWQSRESIFVKQGKLLANYEDDYEFRGTVVRYYPTYQSLTDSELRGYFAWRTKLRRGEICRTSLSFAFLYIYELLNQIGVETSMDGYWKLREFRESYGQLDEGVLPYLQRWMRDYVIYYDLEPALLADSPQVVYDRCITVLENVKEQDEEKVIWAVKQLSPKWLNRSAFYTAYREDMDTVICRVLGRVSDYYAARCKKGMAEQFFGPQNQYQVTLFDAAVFHDPMKKGSREYVLDERCVYQCQNGLWTVRRHAGSPRPSAKLTDLIKTIDAVMREEFQYRNTIQYGTEVKWMLKIIREEVTKLLNEKKEAEARKITIDPARLAKIRADAEITRDKLIVDEEELPLPEKIAEPVGTPDEAEELAASPSASPNETPLNEVEYRLLQCLLYGRDCSWVQAEGYMLSVLSDSINDKLYDSFLDSVMDDTPELVEDYIDDLKEMVHP